MFNSFYKFNYCNNKVIKKGELMYKEHKLTFTCKHNHRYIVNVEQYEGFVFIIKFHLKAHSLSENKYKFLTNFNDCPKVVGTCIQIMLYMYKLNPFASFGFIGAASINEQIKNTRRFIVYRRIMSNYFSPVRFLHYIDTEKSGYLMVNRDNNTEDLKEKIEALFVQHYNF